MATLILDREWQAMQRVSETLADADRNNHPGAWYFYMRREDVETLVAAVRRNGGSYLSLMPDAEQAS